MIDYVLTILASFFLSFAITLPFINLLYKFNIRRISKLDLEKLLPGRTIKMGTPVMGGAVIIFSTIVVSLFLLNDWNYLPMIILVLIFGAIFGGIDEYVNTLGRTFLALRISQSTDKVVRSFFPTNGIFNHIKKTLLVPWKLFEETLRIMGGEQRGLKNHYKFLMYLSVAIIPIIYMEANSHVTSLYLPYLGSFELGYFYYIFLAFLLFGFGTALGITDGMDGLSAGTHSVAFLCYGILASYLGYTEVATLSFILLGTELAFLYFNINPARFEMSDVGTLPIGMVMVLIASLIHREATLLLIGGVFVIEILSSVSQQLAVRFFKKRLFLVAPIHHHFEKLGWPETKVTMRFWIISIILGLLGLALGLS
ncbi:hypothetical protein CO058_03680 [candidate division WWE3 bacterium CG_4_9_14_0_2_um_filter_35_11]|uniref:Phospho-N-acetylmuramoyl-pentapeptide-transferase n=1 Tax=candidate division WWE3 bacterium CG_4_9_14_0_2_um_filter_35_11 TaxID=1975077 RepID=A0A2M8EKY6_UNCKA|nr:MAG: hypothetical protein COV25_02380 [candidate division WWE3 bacterium CG10_big_fil_rev_8_21_14_0_10_35_32]PJC23403.1 MAG: hypothetical protein CO058_03680 [candidate division WWE3 bacterium CG_4_9_14_0_2_um_filter_35_11]